MSNQSVTNELYNMLDNAYKFFNANLFEGKLPDVVIVLQRKGKNNLGYFHPERFMDRLQMTKAIKAKSKTQLKNAKTVSELSLNPDNFLFRTDQEILSTLVHEMCHVERYYSLDKKPRGGYHDKKWGAMMKAVGLYPSNTGEKGGKETGQQMTHYIIKGGPFDVCSNEFLKTNKLLLNSLPMAKLESKKNKVKYICPSCEAKVWGKPNMNIECGDCGESFEEE